VLDYTTAAGQQRLQPPAGQLDRRQPRDRVLEGKLARDRFWYDNEWGFSNGMIDTPG
jgi:hypothetical protein